jgi:glutathione synthase/RimK-type ligase-like ATP-grasp enzyme
LKFAKESAGKLPFFAHLAWDIALTEEGPVVIEINLSPGISGLQMSCGGLRRVFSIQNPEYYWKNPGNR